MTRKLLKSEIPWESIFGWYHYGDFVLEHLATLENGDLKEQEKALHHIELEIEHQGGSSYLAPFAVKELIDLLERKETLVNGRIIEFLNELNEICIEYLELVDDVDNLKKNKYSFKNLLDFLSKHPDKEGENSIWETEDPEGLIIANIITKSLIEKYKLNND